MGILETIDKIDKVIVIAKPIIEGVSSKLQPEMKQFADRLLELSKKYPTIKDFSMIIDKGVDLLTDMLFVLGVKTEPVDIIGFKISQADKGLLDFDSLEDYLNYLKNDINLDMEKYNAMLDVEKLAYTAVGMAIEVGAITKSIGINLEPDFLVLMSKIVNVGQTIIDASGVVDFLRMIKENGNVTITDVYEYFLGTGESDRINTGKILKDIFEILYPGKADDIISNLKDEARV